MPIWVIGRAYTMLLTEGDMFEGVDIGEVGPWWELEEFGVVLISMVETEHSKLVSGVRVAM